MLKQLDYTKCEKLLVSNQKKIPLILSKTNQLTKLVKKIENNEKVKVMILLRVKK